ncbi:MAG: carboxypeptidase-like regulatory domain-containing protein [Balneolales bacterium]
MKIYITLLLYIPILFIAVSQEGSITGKITNDETGQALPGAVVLLETTQFAASTDIEGEYSFTNVPAGEYVMKVTYIGYKEYSSTILHEEGRDLTVNIELEPV